MIAVDCKIADSRDRHRFIGGSDARIIMGDDVDKVTLSLTKFNISKAYVTIPLGLQNWGGNRGKAVSVEPGVSDSAAPDGAGREYGGHAARRSERVEMMQVWADHLDQLRYGSPVDKHIRPFVLFTAKTGVQFP